MSKCSDFDDCADCDCDWESCPQLDDSPADEECDRCYCNLCECECYADDYDVDP